jgi:hypothetical protein
MVHNATRTAFIGYGAVIRAVVEMDGRGEQEFSLDASGAQEYDKECALEVKICITKIILLLSNE